MNLTCAQRKVVEYVSGPLVVLAGPGSGKTRTVIEKIHHLLDTDIVPEPYAILAITHSNAAVREIKHRLAATSFQFWHRIRVSTFHSFAQNILACYGSDIGIREDFRLVVGDERKSMIDESVDHAGLTGNGQREFYSKLCRCKRRGVYPHQIESEKDPRFFNAFNHYQARMAENNALDFEDLCYYGSKLLAESDFVRSLFTNRYRYLIVDEFQDTDNLQFRIARIFAQSALGSTIVADDDQAVYEWRDAVPENVMKFQNELHAELIYLDTNFRSDQVIVEAAQAIIAGASHRTDKIINPSSSDRGILHKSTFQNQREEATNIANRIANLIEQGVSPEEIAVIGRVRYRLDDLVNQIEELSIPFFRQGAEQNLINNVTDVALCIIDYAYSPKRHLALHDLAQSIDDLGISFVRKNQDCYEIAFEVARKLESYGAVDQQTAFMPILDTAGFPSLLGELPNQTVIASQLDSLEELLKMLGDQTHDKDLVPSATIARWRGKNAIQIITGHESKGREYDHVFIVGVEEGYFPHYRSTSEAALNEERRVLYVAMTRARHCLTMTICTRDKRGYNHKASRFLSDVPEALFSK